MEYSLALDRSKSRNSSMNALRKVDKIVKTEERVESFLNSDILAYPEEINYGLFLRTETSVASLSRGLPESFHLIKPAKQEAGQGVSSAEAVSSPEKPPGQQPSILDAEERDLSRFSRIIQLLKRIFKMEHTCEDDFALENFEKSILAAILKRKYGEAPSSKTSEGRLAEQVSAVVRKPSKKRPEEKYKFIFKRAFKILKEQFAKQVKGAAKMKAEVTERAFYEYYFSSYAAKNGLPLEKYFNPKNSTSKNSNYHKTISIEYVNLIKESPIFVNNFMLALEVLVRECDTFIDGKLRGLGLRFVEFYAKEREGSQEQICHYVAKNAKCKLPWTRNEVLEAVDIVKKLFF